MSRRALAALALAALGGCAARPLPPPEPLTATILAGEAGTARVPGWRDLGGPGLDALVAQALAANPDVEAALARVALARADAGEADAARRPQLRLSGSAALDRIGEAVDGDVATVSLRGDMAWEIDLWGRLGRGAQAARRDAEASAADAAGARLLVAGDVADAWFDLAANRALADIAARALANAAETEAITAARVRAGRAAADDLARAGAARLAISDRLAELAADRQRTTSRLAALLGLSAAGYAPPEPPPAALAELVVSPVLPLAALRARPDVRASELRLAASGLRVDAARAAFYPALTLGAGVSSSASALGRALDPATWIAGLALSGAQTLVDGGARRARLAGRAAEQRLALAAHRRVLLAAAAEAETALSDLRQAEARLALTRAQVTLGETGVAAARSRLAAGTASLADVLEDERRLLADRERVVALERERARAAVAVIRAAGGADAG